MATKVDYPEVNKLTRKLVEYTGETVTQAIITALRERLEREKEKKRPTRSLCNEILRIGRECAALPVLDQRTADEILGYDERGHTPNP
jgi:antitoxin VapB